MLWTLIHIIDILLWIVMAGSVVYVLFFALVSLFHNKCRTQSSHTGIEKRHTFLVLFPAYNEDNVILSSVSAFLNQDYPECNYKVAVISDHMSEDTNNALGHLPVTLFVPEFKKSSKAKALQYAMANSEKEYDYVVILDADNIVNSDFLSRLNDICCQGHRAIQCHRCAKNSDNDIAMLDGVSEEINNTIFRKAHNRIGLSSALIGSGMCFEFGWFKDNVNKLSTAGEDREIESLLLSQGIHIKYEESIDVLDEKVSNKDNFQRQRQRWMSAQLNSLFCMLPYIPEAIRRGNIDFVDKTIQQALIPRSILIAGILAIAVALLVLVPVWSAKWWLLFAVLCLSLFISVPSRMRTKAVFSKLMSLPVLVWKMLKGLRRIDRHNKDFIHTTHEK